MGDTEHGMRALASAVRRMRYHGYLDMLAAKAGQPEAFLPIIHHALLTFSSLLARHFASRGFELFGKSDLRFIEAAFRLLRDEFSYMPKLTKEQFFSAGFAGQKMALTTDIIRLCMEKHAEITKTQPSASYSRAARKRVSGVISEREVSQSQIRQERSQTAQAVPVYVASSYASSAATAGSRLYGSASALQQSRSEMGPRSVESGGLSPSRRGNQHPSALAASALAPQAPPSPLRLGASTASSNRAGHGQMLDLSVSSQQQQQMQQQQQSQFLGAHRPIGTSHGPGRGDGLYMVSTTLPKAREILQKGANQHQPGSWLAEEQFSHAIPPDFEEDDMIETIYAHDVGELADPLADVWSDSLEASPFEPHKQGSNHDEEEEDMEPAEITEDDLRMDSEDRHEIAQTKDNQSRIDPLSSISQSLGPLQSRVEELMGRVNRIHAHGAGAVREVPENAPQSAPGQVLRANHNQISREVQVQVQTATKPGAQDLHIMMQALVDSNREMKEMLSKLHDRVGSMQDEFRSVVGDLTGRVILLESKVLSLESRQPSQQEEGEHKEAEAPGSHAPPAPASPRRRDQAGSRGGRSSPSTSRVPLSNPQYRIDALDSVFNQPARTNRDADLKEHESGLQKLQESIARLRASPTVQYSGRHVAGTDARTQ